MRIAWVLLMAATAAHGAKPRPQSLGITGGALPLAMTSAAFESASGDALVTVRLLEEAGGTRLVASVRGFPAGRYPVHLHAAASCAGPEFAGAGADRAGKAVAVIIVEAAPATSRASEGTVDAVLAGVRLRGGDAAIWDSDGSAVIVRGSDDRSALLCAAIAPPRPRGAIDGD